MGQIDFGIFMKRACFAYFNREERNVIQPVHPIVVVGVLLKERRRIHLFVSCSVNKHDRFTVTFLIENQHLFVSWDRKGVLDTTSNHVQPLYKTLLVVVYFQKVTSMDANRSEMDISPSVSEEDDEEEQAESK